MPNSFDSDFTFSELSTILEHDDVYKDLIWKYRGYDDGEVFTFTSCTYRTRFKVAAAVLSPVLVALALPAALIAMQYGVAKFVQTDCIVPLRAKARAYVSSVRRS